MLAGWVARFPVLPAPRSPLPPSAALDPRDGLRSGVAVRVRAACNDHDANGDDVRLRSAPTRIHLAGRLVRKGEVVTHVPPAVTDRRTVDLFEYRVADPTGGVATGVVVVRVDPSAADRRGVLSYPVTLDTLEK